MAGRRIRRAAAVVVLVAVLTGVGLFVGVWLLGDGGGDDPDPEDGASTEHGTATTMIDSVEALADALGCSEVDDDDDSTWVPVPGVESGGCGQPERGHTAGLHVAESAEAQEDLVAYFESSSWELPSGVTPPQCLGDTPEEAEDGGGYHLFVGDRWVVTTSDDEVAAEVQAVLDGAPAEFSPPPRRRRATSRVPSAGRALHRDQLGVMRMMRSPVPLEVPT